MNLPDGLLEAAKARAVAEGVTVTRLMVEGLRARITEPGAGVRRRILLPTSKLGPSSVDLTHNHSTQDILSSVADAKFRDHR